MGGSSPGLVEYDHIFFIAPKCSSDLGGGAAQELILCKTGGGLPQSCFQNHYIFAGGKSILAGVKIILAGGKIILAGGKIILAGWKIILAGLVTTWQSHPAERANSWIMECEEFILSGWSLPDNPIQSERAKRANLWFMECEEFILTDWSPPDNPIQSEHAKRSAFLNNGMWGVYSPGLVTTRRSS